MKITPTSETGRIETLDLLRGFALLGIFIANMIHFNAPILYTDPYSWFEKTGEGSQYMWLDILVEASFYPIFAALFGYGLSMQYEKSMLQNAPFGSVAARRMTILLVIGLLHAIFIWVGDILFTYALMGFLMIALVRIPAKWLAVSAIALYIIPISLFIGLMYASERLMGGISVAEFADIEKIDQSIAVLAHGSYSSIVAFRLKEWLTITAYNFFVNPFMILPLMMAGAAFAKWKFFERAHAWKVRIAVTGAVAFLVGITIKAIPFYVSSTVSMQLIQTYFGGPLVGVGYVCLIVLLCVTLPWFTKVFRPITKAGRMALTTYIGQSIIATLFFYNYGLGMYGKIDIVTGTFMAIGIFIVQALLAEIWLSRYKMGPLEWLWRIGTYGALFPIKKGKDNNMA